MSLTIERDGVPEWFVECTPYEVTDINVIVRRLEPNGCYEPGSKPEFTFNIGDLIKNEVSGFIYLDGSIQMTPTNVNNRLRWADQLELYAQLLRSALRYNVYPDEEVPL